MSTGLLGLLGQEVATLLMPISRAMESPTAFQSLLDELGVIADDDQALSTAFAAIADLKTQLDTLAAQPDLSFESAAALLNVSQRAFQLISAASDTDSPFNTIEGLDRDLADLLVGAWLGGRHPVAHQIAVLLTLLDPAEEQPPGVVRVQDGRAVRAPFQVDRLRFHRLLGLLRDPVATLRSEYVNAMATDDDASAMAAKLFPRVRGLLRELGRSCRYGFNPGDKSLLGDAAPLMAHALIIYVVDPLNDPEAEAGLVVSLSPASRGDLGLVVSPFGTLKTTVPARRWSVELKLTAEVDVFAWGKHGVTLPASFAGTEVVGSAKATLAAADRPAYVLGAKTGTRLEIGAAQLLLETHLSEARQSLALLADVSPAALVIAPGDNDGFVASLLPADGARTEFSLGLSWSSDKGLTFHGAAGLDVGVPVGLSIAGLTLSSIHLGLHALDDSVEAELSARLSASIGPVRALIDRIGLAARLTFPTNGGNLGVADLDLGFKPPSRHRPVRRCAGRAQRRRLPVSRRRAGALCGRDAALAPRAAYAEGVRPHRHAHARRQPRLLAHRLHHRRGLPPDPARPRLHAARHRRHGRRQPHLRPGRAARRA